MGAYMSKITKMQCHYETIDHYWDWSPIIQDGVVNDHKLYITNTLHIILNNSM